jgi:hypothetical protein
VHGAGSGPWIYEEWAGDFPSMRVAAVDLQEGVEVSSASMTDYAERIMDVARSLLSRCPSAAGVWVVSPSCRRPPALGAHSVILIEASPPGEVQGFNSEAEITKGTFDPEAVYGPFPADLSVRPESSLARSERKRGISVPSLLCPSLVIGGDEFRDERGIAIARLYGSEARDFPGLGHWDLVRDSRVREAIADFLGAFRPRRASLR